LKLDSLVGTHTRLERHTSHRAALVPHRTLHYTGRLSPSAGILARRAPGCTTRQGPHVAGR
ncbi:hypothetical protein HAX54_011965, partial [Datura stramonium]|nr:hypothetical protein [Datura stramonium]